MDPLFEPLGKIVQFFLLPVIELYRNEDFAYQLAGLMLMIGLVAMVIGLFRYRYQLRKVDKRIKVITKRVTDKGSLDDYRSSFYEAYPDIKKAFESGRNKRLKAAWAEFTETIINEAQNPIQNSARPHQFFVGSVPAPRWLDFAANLSVGFGLLFTFLGLVAALKFASEGMASDDMVVMQASLRNLLSAASAKFVTSIAGVALSLVFRMLDRRASSAVSRKLTEMCRLLERGFLYAAPQSIALKALAQSEQQTHQLKSMGETIANNVGSAFQKALEPMAINIAGMHKALVEGADDQRESMQKAISEAAGQQMRDLSITLTGLNDLMHGFDEKIETSSAAAARELEQAGGQIKQQIDQLPLVFKNAGEAAAKELSKFMESGINQLEILHSKLDGSIARLGTFDEGLDNFRTGIENSITILLDAAEKNSNAANVTSEIAEKLEALSDKQNAESARYSEIVKDSADAVVKSLQQAEELHAAVVRTQDQITASWTDYTSRFDRVDEHLKNAVESLATELDKFHSGLADYTGRVDGELARSVGRLVDAYDALNDTVSELSNVRVGN